MSVNLSETTTEFLGEPIKLFINGDWHESSTGLSKAVINPSDGNQVASVASGNAQDVNTAVEAAQSAFENWSQLTVHERSNYLFKLADKLEENQATSNCII